MRDEADNEPFIPGLRNAADNAGATTATATATLPAPVAAPAPAAEYALTPGGRSLALLRSYGASVNGTWDLVASLVDSSPYTASRFDSGASLPPI